MGNKLISGLNPSIFEKDNAKFAESLMKQWAEKKCFEYVTPILIQLWLLCGDVSKWTDAISDTLKSVNPIVKGAFWDFLSEIAQTDPNKAKDEWKGLLQSGDVIDSAIADTDNKNNDTKKHAL